MLNAVRLLRLNRILSCSPAKHCRITRKNQRSVVLLSLEDYQALEETAHLLRSPPTESPGCITTRSLIQVRLIPGRTGHICHTPSMTRAQSSKAASCPGTS